jgi:hypothetical protein
MRRISLKYTIDNKYIHFEWSDKLDGQYCFVSNSISKLKDQIWDAAEYHIVPDYPIKKSDDKNNPFRLEIIGKDYKCAYWDPYFEFRIKLETGIIIEKLNNNGEWCAVTEITTDCPSSLYREYRDNNNASIGELKTWLKITNGQVCNTDGTVSKSLAQQFLLDHKQIPKGVKIRLDESVEWSEPTTLNLKNIVKSLMENETIVSDDKLVTNGQLVEFLSKNRGWIVMNDGIVSNSFSYNYDEIDKKVNSSVRIKKIGQSFWRCPIIDFMEEE